MSESEPSSSPGLGSRALARLGRLGGMLVHPRQTLRSMLGGGPGSLYDLLPWMLLLTFAEAPMQAGESLLAGRRSLLEGLMILANAFASRMSAGLLGAVGAAVLLKGLVIAKKMKPDPGFDRILDACAYLLVPYLALSAIGVLLSSMGWELWFMPHRLLKGGPSVLAIRVAVGFGPSILLYGVLLYDLIGGGRSEGD